jgi:hypothetical protein
LFESRVLPPLRKRTAAAAATAGGSEQLEPCDSPQLAQVVRHETYELVRNSRQVLKWMMSALEHFRGRNKPAI